VLLLVVANFFVDGGLANLVPYSPEVFPTHLRAQGMGLSQALNGLGRFAGPLTLALIAGAGTDVDPDTVTDAITPGFLFLAGCTALATIPFLTFAPEPHGRSLESLAADMEDQRDGERPKPAAAPPEPARSA
jgi:MFS transporter, putative metabolite:H+ symporter